MRNEIPNSNLWSLWDLLEIEAKPFVDALDALIGVSASIRVLLDRQPNDQSRLKTVAGLTKKGALGDLAALSDACGALGADVSKKAADRLHRRLKRGVNYEELGSAIAHLSNTFRDEIETSKLFALEKRVAKHFANATELFGSEVVATFLEAEYDLEEAGKCLATARNTASVFHLMRALEVVVQALCSPLGITNTEREWGKLLSDINKAIDQMPKGDEKTEWAQASAYLWQIKEVWRNNTMHPKETYTDDEAREVFEASRNFIRHAAPMVLAKLYE